MECLTLNHTAYRLRQEVRVNRGIVFNVDPDLNEEVYSKNVKNITQR